MMKLGLCFAVLQYCAVHVIGCSLQSHCTACEQNKLLKKDISRLYLRYNYGVVNEESRSQAEVGLL